MVQSVKGWLEARNLGQYADEFMTNDVDIHVLPHLTNEDLRELGVSLGHRKIILAAIASEQRESLGIAVSQVPIPLAPALEPSVPTQSTAALLPQTERRSITVMFVDLVGSTEIVNRTDPEEMRALMQRYQDTVAEEVSRFGGHIAKLLGDGMLIFFGWPTAFEDHTYRALKAGLETIDQVRLVKDPSGKPLATRIGIASGPVVVGDLPTANTLEEGAATGRILNLAARIQSKAARDSIVIPAENLTSVERAFEIQTLGTFELKGFVEPQHLFEVIRERAATGRFQSTHGNADCEIIGRKSERDLLRQAWERTCAGNGELAILVGEAGIGKSRLTEDFLQHDVDHATSDLVRLNASPYFSKSPFHPVIERISQDAGVLSDEDDKKSAERIRQSLALRGLADGETLSVFAALVAPNAKLAQEVSRLPPQEQNDLTIHTLVDALKARARANPVLLLLEDAHWIDPSTLRIIERVIATCSDIPLMVLVTHRPDWSHDWSHLTSDLTTIQLRRLQRAHVAELVSQIVGFEAEPDFVDEVLSRTDGVPLYVEEVARVMLASNGKEASEVPSTLQGAMMARLDAIPPQAKELAMVASVFGREFESALLANAMNVTETEIANGLEHLRRAGLVFESGQKSGVHVFRHALLRDTAYQSMVSQVRRGHHHAAAQALISLKATEIEREPDLVANHLFEANAFSIAYEYQRSATEKALARSASEEAVYHAERLVQIVEQIEAATLEQHTIAKILLGHSFESIGRLPEAMVLLKDAAETSRDSGWYAHFAEAAYRFLDATLMVGHEVDRAYALCKEALSVVPDNDEALRCQMLSQLARCSMHEGEFGNSRKYSQEAIALAERLDDPRAQFAVRMSRFFAPLIARDETEVRNWRTQLSEMGEIADQLDDTDRGRDRSLNFFVSIEMGDRAQAENSLERLNQVGKARNHQQLHWVERHGRAMMAIMDGKFDVAKNFAEEALKIGRLTHGTHIEGVYGTQMFSIRREQARLNEVAPVFKRLLDENPEDSTWKPGFAVIAAELGYDAPALRILSGIAESRFELPMDSMYSTTLSYLAEVCILTGDDTFAEALYTLLLPYKDINIMAGVTTVCNGAAARRLAGLAVILGERSTALEHFEVAMDLDTRMKASPWIAHSKSDYANALRLSGNQQDKKHADLLESEALDIALALGMLGLEKKIKGRIH